MTEINAYSIGINYMELYGLHTKKLGCVMLDTESPWGANPKVQEIKEYLRKNEYKSDTYPWIQGLCEDWHLTLRYGFLPEVSREHLMKIIDCPGLAMSKPTNRPLTTGPIEVWPSPNGEEYECVVLRVSDPMLNYWYNLFGMLPNIVTFPEYKPHITIGFFKPDTWAPLFDEAFDLSVMSTNWRFNSALS